MSLSLEQVRHVASLARLSLTAEEEALYARQLSAILEAVALLESVPTDDVPPTHHVAFGVTPLRADEVRPSLPPEKSLANAPSKVGTSFGVPRVLE